jgi:hypothetical protein
MTALHRSAACLRLLGDDLEPDEVTALLGATPTASEHKGAQSQPNSGGRTFTARTGAWRLKVEDRRPADLDAQVSELLEQVTSDLDVWSALGARFRIDLFCGVFMNEQNEGVSLAPSTLQALGERGILLDLDIYGPTE